MKKKGQNAKAGVAESVSDTNVLTTSIDHTSTDKCCILDSGSAVHVCSHKDMFNSLVSKGGRDCQNGGWLSLRGHRHWDSQCYRLRWDDACSGGDSVYPGGMVQSNIYRGARLKGMSDPSVTRSHHG